MADDFIRRADVLACKGDCYDSDGHLLYAVGTGDILRIPAADVRPVVHARWVDTQPELQNWQSRKDGMAFYCSACKHRAGKHKHTTYQYCPWCGAMMDGGGQRC